MIKKTPIYNLSAFKGSFDTSEFYCNYLNPHIKEHKFTNLPHKHDFYLIMIVTGGTGWHEIDFTRHEVQKGSVFMMQPGQMHYWKLSDDISGYVFFHSPTFYNEGYTMANIQNFDFFKSFQSSPSLKLSKQQLTKLCIWMEEIIQEYTNPNKYVFEKVHALINIIYIELSRNYIKHDVSTKQSYLHKLHEFELLIENNFKKNKSASSYATQLNISEKHLNRITRECLNKTSTQLITDRIILEAKRLLIQTKLNVSQIGYELGYVDNSYFVRLFKKHTKETPLLFLKRQNNKIY